MTKIPIVVIAGATASGKTALSVELAKKFGGEIISADSMQIYKAMNIGTAKPDDAEKEGIVHHLMDCIDPCDEFSVADYVSAAHECIQNVIKKNKLPIVVGGTGLYINSLVNDYSFDDHGEDSQMREELQQIAETKGASALLDMLSKFDPISAANLHPNNLRRIIRAIEFYKITGKAISEHNLEMQNRESRYEPLMMAIQWDMSELYERIEKRVEFMMKSGLLEEVMTLAKKGYNKKYQSMQGIGYKQLLDYYRGFTTLDEAVRILKRDSRRYAKRQMTWFRRDERILWIKAKDDILKKATEATENFLHSNKI